jgi:hypothetical protein
MEGTVEELHKPVTGLFSLSGILFEPKKRAAWIAAL